VPGEAVRALGKFAIVAKKVSCWFTVGVVGPAVWLTIRARAEVVTVTVVLPWFAATLVLKFGSVELKAAVILWLPSEVRVYGGQVPSTPLVREAVQAVIVVLPTVSLNVTVPFCGTVVPGYPEPLFAGTTVPVKVTLPLVPTEEALEETVVAEGAGCTVCDTLSAVPWLKFVSPL